VKPAPEDRPVADGLIVAVLVSGSHTTDLIPERHLVPGQDTAIRHQAHVIATSGSGVNQKPA
jgi:hypothetical protein